MLATARLYWCVIRVHAQLARWIQVRVPASAGAPCQCQCQGLSKCLTQSSSQPTLHRPDWSEDSICACIHALEIHLQACELAEDVSCCCVMYCSHACPPWTMPLRHWRSLFHSFCLSCVVTSHVPCRRCLGRPAHSLEAVPASLAYFATSHPGHRSAGHIGLGSPDEQLCPHCWLCGGLSGMLYCPAEQTSESATGSGLHCLKKRICCLPTIS